MEGGPQLNTPTFPTCDSYQCTALVLVSKVVFYKSQN